jgi:phenylacetate-CoA ligase
MVVKPPADFRLAARGVQSHTVLVTNLLSRDRRAIRCDSILVRPEPCPRGNPLPAVRVLGRVADILMFGSDSGGEVKLTAMQFSIIFDRIAEVQLFQIT